MPRLAEHDRCQLARTYRTAVTLAARRELAATYGLSLRELALLAR